MTLILSLGDPIEIAACRIRAELALASGYHDQAHLTREGQALAGCTPAQWILRELPFVQDELTGL